MTTDTAHAQSAQFSTADLAITTEEHWPHYSEAEIEAVAAVLRSGKVNQWTGDRVFAFQDAYEQYVGHGRRALALANGSVALEVALRAWGVGRGDEVITTPRTFAASAFCAMLVGATPVFAEIDRDSGNITAETIAEKITPRTKAIIPVHLGGWPCDMPAICALAEQHGVKVLEDCAQAHGAEIDGRPVGTFGDAAAFSFCQDKIMSTGGEGGMTLFRDDADYEWAWGFKDHGKDRRTVFSPPAQPGFRWLLERVGTNWRMLETSAVIGLAQLAQLDSWRAVRGDHAATWAEALGGVDGIRVPVLPSGITHANYKFYAYIDRGRDSERLRDAIVARATELGIRAFSGSCSEVYREAAFADLGVERLPVARELGEASLMFEVHPTLDRDRLRARAAAVAEIARTILR